MWSDGAATDGDRTDPEDVVMPWPPDVVMRHGPPMPRPVITIKSNRPRLQRWGEAEHEVILVLLGGPRIRRTPTRTSQGGRTPSGAPASVSSLS